jgi:hypothetical protein
MKRGIYLILTLLLVFAGCSGTSHAQYIAVFATQEPSGGTAPSFSGSGCGGNGFSETAQACTTNLPGTLNDYIVMAGFGGSGTLSASIASGGTCAVSSWSNATSTGSMNVFWGKITTGGATCKPQFNDTASGSIQMVAGEVTGTTGVDVSGGAADAFTTSPTCSSVTTTLANDLVVCPLVDSGAESASFTATGGATNLLSQPFGFGASIQYQTKASAGTIAPTATYSGGTTTIYFGTVAFHP